MDIMIDIETLSTENNAVVLSIGACAFNSNKIESSFHHNLNMLEQVAKGRYISPHTCSFWNEQPVDKQKVIMEGAGFNNKAVLLQFIAYIDLYPEAKVWGNGACFDIIILENLLKDYGLRIPWKFTNIMDLRTFRRMVAKNAKIPRDPAEHHDALKDALAQAKYVMDYSLGDFS